MAGLVGVQQFAAAIYATAAGEAGTVISRRAIAELGR